MLNINLSEDMVELTHKILEKEWLNENSELSPMEKEIIQRVMREFEIKSVFLLNKIFEDM